MDRSPVSPLSHSIAAMVRRERAQAHRELDRRQEQLQQLLDYNQTHDLDPRLTEGFYRCLQAALQAMDLAQRDALSLSRLELPSGTGRPLGGAAA